LHCIVSIPSNGSIQFLRIPKEGRTVYVDGLNPLKRVNSILTMSDIEIEMETKLYSLNPLKRVNSILTMICQILKLKWKQN